MTGELANSLAVNVESVRVLNLIVFKNADHRVHVGRFGCCGIKAAFVNLMSNIQLFSLTLRSGLGVMSDDTVDVAARNAGGHVRR